MSLLIYKAIFYRTSIGHSIGHRLQFSPIHENGNKKQPAAARSQEDSVIEFSFSFKPQSGERCT